jgi:hypothetical protein
MLGSDLHSSSVSYPGRWLQLIIVERYDTGTPFGSESNEFSHCPTEWKSSCVAGGAFPVGMMLIMKSLKAIHPVWITFEELISIRFSSRDYMLGVMAFAGNS